jgi:hypothetical protein
LEADFAESGRIRMMTINGEVHVTVYVFVN